MTIEEYALGYKTMSHKDLAKYFNELELEDRRIFLDSLSSDPVEYDKFITKIRNQAVFDCLTHEQELLKKGKCTRNWTPEQIEEIMAISKKTGVDSINGGRPYEVYGTPFYGHHMLSVSNYPEYAGDWRNIQPLTKEEHVIGAHQGNTKKPTYGYYDVDGIFDTYEDNESRTKVFDVQDNVDFFKDSKYPPEVICIFKSNQEIKANYGITDDLKAGEMLALKITYRLDFIYFLYKTIPLVNFSNS